MQTLTIDPPIPFVLPPRSAVAITLVGCGGTGSHIAQALARLAAHCRDTGGPAVSLSFVDGDTVEAKNVGRQLFGPADVGHNKAQVLAARFSALFGLRIDAVPRMLDEAGRAGGMTTEHILVGAVDTAAARRHMAGLLEDCALWLDCGNHESSGQVVVGSVAERRQLRGALALKTLCSALPAPSLVYPDLLKDAPKRRRADCAAATFDNAQSLMVNQQMAAIAAQYLYQIVVQRRLTTFCTTVDLDSLSMRSTPITAANLAAATGVAPSMLYWTEGDTRERTAPRRRPRAAA